VCVCVCVCVLCVCVCVCVVCVCARARFRSFVRRKFAKHVIPCHAMHTLRLVQVSSTRHGSARRNKSSYPQHLLHTSTALSPASFRIVVSTPGAQSSARRVARFTESIEQSMAAPPSVLSRVDVDDARWSAVCPPVVRALTSAPFSNNNVTALALAHRAAECSGVHLNR
jgi:hypothetical protein